MANRNSNSGSNLHHRHQLRYFEIQACSIGNPVVERRETQRTWRVSVALRDKKGNQDRKCNSREKRTLSVLVKQPIVEEPSPAHAEEAMRSCFAYTIVLSLCREPDHVFTPTLLMRHLTSPLPQRIPASVPYPSVHNTIFFTLNTVEPSRIDRD